MSKNIDVAIIMGSDSDLPIMKDAAKFLEDMGIPYEIKILSVHRTPEKAMEYAAQAVLGAAAMCLTDGAHPGPLKDAVCSPGGSTIAGVHALERAGVRGAAMDAVTAAFEKTKQMAKG